MSLLSRWLESLDYDYAILSHCSRHQSPRSSCTECIDHCPEDAIQLKDGKPKINADKCTECGDCVASCPVQAVEGFLPKRSVSNGEMVADSEKAPTRKELLAYYKEGVTTIVVQGEGLNPEWKKAISEVDRILDKLGEKPFKVSTEHAELAEEEQISRRELFFSWGKDLKQIARDMTPAKWRFNHESLDIAKYYPDHQFVDISINTTDCTLCQACQTLCKKDALQIDDNSFTILAQQCSNCGLCQDICPEKAITLRDQISPAVPVNHQVHSNVCSTCGDTFPTLNKEQDLCMLCKKKKEFSMM